MSEIIHAVIIEIIVGWVIGIAKIITRLTAIPIAESIVMAWTRVCTSHLRADVRDRRVREMQSEVSEQRRADASSGYTDEQVAKRILTRWARGIPDDLSRSAREWMSLRLRRREVQPPPLEEDDEPRPFRVVLPAGIEDDPAVTTLIARPSSVAGAYWVGDGRQMFTIGTPIHTGAEQMRRAAIFTQQMGMWGDEFVPPSRPDASSDLLKS